MITGRLPFELPPALMDDVNQRKRDLQVKLLTEAQHTPVGAFSRALNGETIRVECIRARSVEPMQQSTYRRS